MPKPKKQNSWPYAHAKQVSWRRVGDETIVLDLDSSDYFSLNEVGALVWKRLGEGSTVKAICDEICKSYKTTAARATADINRLVAQLLKRKLLVVRK